MSSKENLGERIYSGISSIGTIYALVSAIFTTFICIFFVFAGVLMVKESYNQVKRTERRAKVISIGIEIVVQYEDGTQKVVPYPGTGSYSVGQIVNVYVSDKDSNDVTLVKPSSIWIGIGVILFCIFISGLSWFWYWASKKSKFIGAMQAGSGIFNTL